MIVLNIGNFLAKPNLKTIIFKTETTRYKRIKPSIGFWSIPTNIAIEVNPSASAFAIASSPKAPPLFKSFFYSVLFLLSSFSLSLLFNIFLRNRMDFGVTSQYSSSFKYSNDCSSDIILGLFIVTV